MGKISFLKFKQDTTLIFTEGIWKSGKAWGLQGDASSVLQSSSRCPGPAGLPLGEGRRTRNQKLLLWLHLHIFTPFRQWKRSKTSFSKDIHVRLVNCRTHFFLPDELKDWGIMQHLCWLLHFAQKTTEKSQIKLLFHTVACALGLVICSDAKKGCKLKKYYCTANIKLFQCII